LPEQKKELTPDHKLWPSAVESYKKNSSFDIIEARMIISDENKKRIEEEAKNA